MPRYWCAVWIVIAAAAAAPNAAAQQPASAGATRPNLRVLHALPESQLFPLMNLLADSLGVRCDYCHVQVAPDLTRTPSNIGGWVWDRDDQPPKRTAREMMRMVIDLNVARFKALEHDSDLRRDCRVLGDADAARRRLVHEELGGDVENGKPSFLCAIAVGCLGRLHLVCER